MAKADYFNEVKVREERVWSWGLGSRAGRCLSG